MIVELLDRRVLGALRFRDAITDLVIDEPLSVAAPGVRWIRNRRACYVVVCAPGLEAHEEAFRAPPAEPPPESVRIEFTVRDPRGRYLPRRGILSLPRLADPARAGVPASLFGAADVPLYPAPAGATSPGWAVVRASVAGNAAGSVLQGALIRVVRQSDERRIGGGMADARGEALVAVQGIPSTTFGESEGPVLATEVTVRLEVVWDPDAGAIPDPDDLEARRDELRVRSRTTTLASGRVVAMRL